MKYLITFAILIAIGVPLLTKVLQFMDTMNLTGASAVFGG